jgi:hypothetical protein
VSDHFSTTLRLPPHRLEIEEAKFLRLLAGCLSLHTIEKRAILRGFGKLSQFQVDELIREFEHELKEQEARNLMEAGRRERYQREREKRMREWREMEREMGN